MNTNDLILLYYFILYIMIKIFKMIFNSLSRRQIKYVIVVTATTEFKVLCYDYISVQ